MALTPFICKPSGRTHTMGAFTIEDVLNNTEALLLNGTKCRTQTIPAFNITDICDNNETLLLNGDLRVLDPIFKIYGQRRCFSGRIMTLKVFENNYQLINLLEIKGEGRVVVMEGGGNMRRALMGGMLSLLAQLNGWEGVVVNGCIRDVDEINARDLGVRALGTYPVRPDKTPGFGEKNVPVYVAGTLIREGEWLYADNDGILISKTQLSL